MMTERSVVSLNTAGMVPRESHDVPGIFGQIVALFDVVSHARVGPPFGAGVLTSPADRADQA